MYVCGRFSSCLPAKQCCQPLSAGLSSGQTLSAKMRLAKEKLAKAKKAMKATKGMKTTKATT